MEKFLQMSFRENPKMFELLKQNSYYFKGLNRGVVDYKKFVSDIKVKYKESTKTPGLVISQSIKENEVVTKNTTITLTISKKKETTPETPPSGGNTEPPSGGGETNTENPPSGGGNTEKPSGGTGTNTVVNNA